MCTKEMFNQTNDRVEIMINHFTFKNTPSSMMTQRQGRAIRQLLELLKNINTELYDREYACAVRHVITDFIWILDRSVTNSTDFTDFMA